MSRIKEHMFASEENTPIFESIDSDHIIAYIPKGSWMGVVDKCRDRIRIVSSKFDGWVFSKSGLKEAKLAKNVKITQGESGIEYIIPRLELKAC